MGELEGSKSRAACLHDEDNVVGISRCYASVGVNAPGAC